jgi:uncharacterized protein
MSLRERFSTEMKEAMKSRQQSRLSTIRLMMAKLKDVDIEARGKGEPAATDTDILSMLAKMIKQRQDSIAVYEQGKRLDLAEIEKEEIKVIEEFMPVALTAEEVSAAIATAIAETGASSIKEMGKIVNYLKERYTGQMDFGQASTAIKAALAS